MRAEKSNFAGYSSLSKIDSASRPTNIIDLLKKNKEEEKKENILRIYITLGSFALILFVGLIIYL